MSFLPLGHWATLCESHSVVSDSATPWSDYTVHGILQARILEWVAVPFSRDLPNPGIKSRSPALRVDSLPAEPQGKSKNTGVGSLSVLQRIFQTQELNRGLLEKAMATDSSTLAWKIPWTEKPGRLQSTGSLRVGYDWVAENCHCHSTTFQGTEGSLDDLESLNWVPEGSESD